MYCIWVSIKYQCMSAKYSDHLLQSSFIVSLGTYHFNTCLIMFWCPIWSIALVLDLFIYFQPNNNFTLGSGPLLCMSGMSPIFYSYVCLYFSTIYFILNILHMDINRSTSPAAQLWFVHLIPLYATYDKYFHLTTTMTHFYEYHSTFNSNMENKFFISQVAHHIEAKLSQTEKPEVT